MPSQKTRSKSPTPTRLTLRVAADASAERSQFSETLQSEFHATHPALRITDTGFRVDIDLEDIHPLLDAAEDGTLDALLKACGGQWIHSIVVGGECIYTYLPPIAFRLSPSILDISTEELLALRDSVQLLLVTTTPVERHALYQSFSPLPGTPGLLEGALGQVTYRIGRFGRYCAAHVECTMSGEGRDGATLTVRDAVDELTPKAIIVVGIAFGLDRKKTRIGDVLVAESIQPYELQRVGDALVQRGQSLPCGTILSERLRTRATDWKLDRGLDKVQVHHGLVLSGAKLVDNVRFRDALYKAFPTSIGGEMEGAGAYAAAHRSSAEIILVKAICDWADGFKNDRGHPFAAFAATSLAHHIMSKKDVLRSLQAVELPDAIPLVATASEAATGQQALIGRDNELDELAHECDPTLVERGHRVAAIFVHGMHGIGKTRLMLEFAERARRDLGRPTSYVDFQSEELVDAAWAKQFLPKGPHDGGLFNRMWNIGEVLATLGTNRIVIFDEIEVLLHHMKQESVVRILQRAGFTSRQGAMPVFVVRRNWPWSEGFTHGSPRLVQAGLITIGPLSSFYGSALAHEHLGTMLIGKARDELASEIDFLAGGIPYLLRHWAADMAARVRDPMALPVEARLAQYLRSAEGYFRVSWDTLDSEERYRLVSAALAAMETLAQGRLVNSSSPATGVTAAYLAGATRLCPAFAWFVATELATPERLAQEPHPGPLNSSLQRLYEVASSIGQLTRLLEGAQAGASSDGGMP